MICYVAWLPCSGRAFKVFIFIDTWKCAFNPFFGAVLKCTPGTVSYCSRRKRVDDLCARLVKPSRLRLSFSARTQRADRESGALAGKSHPWPLVPLHLAWNKLDAELAVHNFFRACTVRAHIATAPQRAKPSVAQSFIKNLTHAQLLTDWCG